LGDWNCTILIGYALSYQCVGPLKKEQLLLFDFSNTYLRSIFFHSFLLSSIPLPSQGALVSGTNMGVNYAYLFGQQRQKAGSLSNASRDAKKLAQLPLLFYL